MLLFQQSSDRGGVLYSSVPGWSSQRMLLCPPNVSEPKHKKERLFDGAWHYDQNNQGQEQDKKAVPVPRFTDGKDAQTQLGHTCIGSIQH